MAEAPSSGLARLVKVIVGVVAAALVVWFLFVIRVVLAPFVIAFVLAYVLAPLVDRLEGRGLRRSTGVLLIFLVLFGGLGLVVGMAGGAIVGEVKGLVDGVLQKEVVERQLLVTNQGVAPVTVQAWWEREAPPQPFALPDLENGQLKLGPGRVETVRLRFAPRDTAEAGNVLYLAGAEWTAPVGIRVRGNVSPRRDHERADAFWTGKAGERIQVQEVVISAGGLDFGRAGPNLISSLSEQARALNPRLTPYLGEDFDLAAVVARYGRSLVEERLVGKTGQVLGGLFSGITYLALVPFVAFFFLNDGRRITRDLIRMVPNAYFELCLNLLYQINGQIGGYIRGQVLESGVVAGLSVTALLLIGVDYAVPLGLLAGMANVIPYLGPAIGIVSTSLVALSAGGGFEVIWKVVVAFAVIQFVDNMFVQPAVLARSVEMHPLVVLFVVMVGSQLMGIVGMLIAVPVAGVVKVSVRTVYQGLRGYRRE